MYPGRREQASGVDAGDHGQHGCLADPAARIPSPQEGSPQEGRPLGLLLSTPITTEQDSTNQAQELHVNDGVWIFSLPLCCAWLAIWRRHVNPQISVQSGSSKSASRCRWLRRCFPARASGLSRMFKAYARGSVGHEQQCDRFWCDSSLETNHVETMNCDSGLRQRDGYVSVTRLPARD